MERWAEWVLAILIVAGIIGLVSLARGEPGRGDLPPAIVVVAAAT